MRVRDISFYDPRAQGSEDDKTMDFPLALMKTAQAVIQDGHKLFRFGMKGMHLAHFLCDRVWLKFRSHGRLTFLSAMKCCPLVCLCAMLGTRPSPRPAKSACSTGLI